uniref:Putative secreted protein n=1 Tax=Anopheles darlingi TaxID=43151 RepID=A0A2M4DIK1_ANODA
MQLTWCTARVTIAVASMGHLGDADFLRKFLTCARGQSGPIHQSVSRYGHVTICSSIALVYVGEDNWWEWLGKQSWLLNGL